MNVMVSSSPIPKAHPPRSKPFLRSSSDAPPLPCITPSTVTCVMVVSFMSPVLLRWLGRRSIRPDRRTDLIGHGTRGSTDLADTACVDVVEESADVKAGEV